MAPLLEMIIAFPLFGLVAAFVARSKGYDFLTWWLFGTVLGIIATPVALFALRPKWPDRVVLDQCEHEEAYVLAGRPKAYVQIYEGTI